MGDCFDELKIIKNWQLCVGGTVACQEEIQPMIINTGGSYAPVINVKPAEPKFLLLIRG